MYKTCTILCIKCIKLYVTRALREHKTSAKGAHILKIFGPACGCQADQS